MQEETKKCQNCKSEFTIEPEDFAFYEKISVSPPTWCSECRLQRRMMVSNERALYKIPCGLCKKDIIAMYHKDQSFPVYCIDCWRSDKWDALEYGTDYEFSEPFFEQFLKLKNKVPRMVLVQQGEMPGSQYCNRASNDKNCYLCFRTNLSEDCLYSHLSNNSNDGVDSFNVQKCELTYNSIDCVNCYDIKYCQECKDCTNSYFLYDCRNCSDCFGCAGLRNKQYYIFNQPYSKEDYLDKLKGFNLDNFESIESLKIRFRDFRLEFIRKYMMETQSANVSGNWLMECKNVYNSYSCRSVEDAKNILGIVEAKDCMDYFYWGRGCELMYEISNCGYNCSRLFFSNECFPGCNDLQYCDNCRSCSDLFGCIGLRHKQYCILNKQYTKEEYEELVPKIIQHMNDMPYTDKKGRVYKYGEFFPPELSPFAYNETVAQEYFPLTKKEAEQQGYSWKEPEKRDYQITIKAEDLPDHIKDVPDSIVDEIIGCQHEGKCQEQCTEAFKIIPQELEFYRKMNLSLPRLCPNCRHYQRIKQRNPLKLWHRKCQCAGEQSDPSTSSGQVMVYKNTISHNHGKEHCPSEFETTYSPERKEIVYCEECYLKEVV